MTLPTLFDAAAEARARTTDPATSREAAAGNHGAQRHAVLLALAARGNPGMTDQEIGEALGILRTSAGKRRLELLRDGLVSKTGLTRPTDTGARAIVWRITERGLTAAARALDADL